MFNPTRMLFLMTLMLGTVLALSSSNWLGCWVGLEINLLSFIPLMNSKSQFASEAALKYFLVQALASTVLLMGVLLVSNLLNTPYSQLTETNNYSLMISSALLLKMGAAPMHFWFPGVMEGLDWINNLILMTWQKIAPFMLLSYLINPTIFFSILIMCSIGFGSIGGLNQTSLRKLMAYSSINHLGWMIAAMMFSNSYWAIYFSIYTTLNLTMVLIFNNWKLNHTLQIYGMSNNKMTNLILFCNLLSLGGLPPFLGFAPKWLVIQLLVQQGYLFLALFMVTLTLVALYFYARLSYPPFLIAHGELLWTPLITSPVSSSILAFSCLSLGGLIFSPLLSFVM